MALKPLNSVGGFSVGEVPANVILANADITANNATFSGNLLISNSSPGNVWGVLTDNLYYSNGTPWDFQQAAGSNGEIQYNMGDDFAASANFVWDQANNVLIVTGNANISGTLQAGAIITSGLANGNSNVAIPVANGNVNISATGNANVLVVTGSGVNVAGYFDATGNVEGANLRTNEGYVESTNASVGLYLVPANTAAGIVAYSKFTPNSNVSHDLGSVTNNWANVYANNAIIAANITSGNANLGNAVLANYMNVNFDVGVTQTVFAANLVANVSANVSNIQVANFVVSNLTPSTDDQYSLGTTLKRWKDINISGNANIATLAVSGNGTFGNLNFGNLLTGNYANFSNDVVVQGNIANVNNISITNALAANTGNFSGNITSLNANLGNVVNANYVNINNDLDVNGNIDATFANFVGNVSISNSNPAYGIKTDNLYYSNGTPWDLQEAAGSNNEIQFNTNDNFDASANFTFNPSTNLLTVNGNANVTNTLLTPNVNSGSGNLTLTANGFNTVYDTSGNVTFPGNVTAHTFYGNVNANVTVSAANTTVLFSDAGAISGQTGFTFNKTSNLVTMTGNLQLGLAGYNKIQNNSNAALEIQGGWDQASGSGVNIVAGDYNNNSNWGKLSIQGNVSGNSVGYSEANAFVFTNPGYGSGNVVKVDILNPIASSTTTGVIQANGGIGVTGNGYFGGNLVVTGDIANANNISVTNALNAVTGNFSGNINSLNANLGNLAKANFVQTDELLNGNSNIRIAANGNIALSLTGLSNVFTFSNVGANVVGYVSANGNGTFGALYSNTLTAQGGNLTIYAAAGDNYVELRPTGNGHIDAGNFRIQNLGNPVAAQDAATKFYVDTVAEGLHIHASCGAATPDTLANISSGTVTYNNGTAGVGATLVTTGTYTLIDGVNVASSGFRILVKNETNTAHNGIYTYTNSTTLTRATDFDTAAEIAGGDFTFVTGGTLYDSTGWVQIDEVTTVGTDPIVWEQFSGSGSYTAGAGLTLTGTVFSVNVDNVTTEIAGGNVVVKANAQLTTPNIGAATGTSLNLTGNLLANNVNSNNLVTTTDLQASGNILAANISANANLIVSNATVNLSLTGNTANFSGNVVVPNLTVNLELAGNTANFSGNLVAANLVTSGTANVANLNVTANVTSALTPNANLTLDLGSSTQRWQDVYAGNIDGSGNITLTGNITANNYTSNTVTANTQVNIGNSEIRWAEVTTTSTTANQSISTAAVSGVTGIEWIVKAVDSTGAKYSMAIVTAVTDGTSADYSTFGTVNLGATTGTLAVNIVGSNLELQVTPSSSNSTVWVTQYRTI